MLEGTPRYHQVQFPTEIEADLKILDHFALCKSCCNLMKAVSKTVRLVGMV